MVPERIAGTIAVSEVVFIFAWTSLAAVHATLYRRIEAAPMMCE
jgi:hypothetical protein